MAKYEVDGTSARAPQEDGPSLRLVKNGMTLDLPGHVGVAPDGTRKPNSKIIDFNEAAKRLRGSEAAASGEMEQGASGLDGVRDREAEADGFYSGNGKPIDKNSRNPNKRYGKGWFKKVGPLAGILITILLFGSFAFGGLSTQLISWKENISSMFGQSSAVMNKRSNFVMKKLLSTNRETTSTNIFGKTKFKISSKLSEKLAAQGINYVETDDANGKKIKMLVYEDADGKVIPIVASDSDVARANTLVGSEIEIDGRKVTLNSDSMTLSEARTKSKSFDVDYDTATMTFTGKIAGWFDNVADTMYERIVGKNARNQTNVDDPDEESVGDMLRKNSSNGADDSEVMAEVEETDDKGKKKERPAEASDEFTDDSGKTHTYGEIESESGKIKTNDADFETAEATASSSLKARAQKVAMMSSTLACGFLRSVGTISVAVGAIQTANVINYASKYLELADKTKNGDADEVTNIALDDLNEPVTTTAYDFDGVSNESKVVAVNGSVTSSAGWNAPFSSKNIVDENDPSAMMSNREMATKNALRGMSSGGLFGNVFADVVGALGSFAGGVTAFKVCNGVEIVAGLVDGVSDVVLAFSTVGIGNFIKEIFKGALKGALFSAIMIAVTSLISVITPMVANWLVGNLSNVFLGKNGGFALLTGSQSILQSNLQMGTGRYADRENAIEVAALTREVEDQWAAYERATKSPFDTTSKYTFMGSIVNAMIPIANTTSGTLTSVITPVAELAGSSALALVNPSASAASDVSEFAASLASDDNCAYLSSVNVAGDFACNKYAGAYVDELTTMDPDTVYENIKGNFDGEYSDGNPKVDVNSEYAKYIIACVTSDSQPGTMNSAVQGFATKATTTGNTVADGLINFGSNFVPFEGFLDAWKAGEEQANFTWNSGEACTGKTDDSALNERVKNYSMYNLDQRVLYDMGIIENNSTVSFLEEYYKENPLDDSFEGRIARFSGMTKEEVSDTLALIEYYNFVENYDPSERYAFGEPKMEENRELRFDNENSVADNTWGILLDQVSYADVRNRSFAV